MKNFFALSFILSLCLFSSATQARIRNIVEWDGGENPYKQGDRDITGAKFESTCGNSCPGYSLTVTHCGDGMRLEHCASSGCGYYNRCVENSGNIEVNDNSEEDEINMDEINIDEVYNSIIEEQNAAQDEAARENQ